MKRLAPLHALAALALAAASLTGQQPLLVEGVTIVSPDLPGPMADASILIRDGRSVAIGRTGPFQFPETSNALMEWGSGSFLVSLSSTRTVLGRGFAVGLFPLA